MAMALDLSMSLAVSRANTACFSRSCSCTSSRSRSAAAAAVAAVLTSPFPSTFASSPESANAAVAAVKPPATATNASSRSLPLPPPALPPPLPLRAVTGRVIVPELFLVLLTWSWWASCTIAVSDTPTNVSGSFPEVAVAVVVAVGREKKPRRDLVGVVLLGGSRPAGEVVDSGARWGCDEIRLCYDRVTSCSGRVGLWWRVGIGLLMLRVDYDRNNTDKIW